MRVSSLENNGSKGRFEHEVFGTEMRCSEDSERVGNRQSRPGD